MASDNPGRATAASSTGAYVDAWRRRIDDELRGLAPVDEPGALYEPVRFVLEGRGKRLRPLIVLLACEAFDKTPEAALPAALAVETFHAFTLVHDDIMDRASTRRGRAAVHAKWDESTAILTGDYLMALSYRLLSDVDEEYLSRALYIYHEMVARLCEGQALDKAFETRPGVTLADYLRMIDRKTGALLKAAFQLGALVGGASVERIDAFGSAGADIGRAFQIQDDLLDLTADDDRWGKQTGTDLMEGKKTYLLLRALEKAPDEQREWFRQIVLRNGLREDEIGEAGDRMKRLGVLDDARAASHDLMQAAYLRLEDLELGGGADALFWLLDLARRRVH